MRILILLVFSLTLVCHCYEQVISEHSTEMDVVYHSYNIRNSEEIATDFWSGIVGEDHVTKLNSNTFIPFISQNDSFVMFYANWCIFSKQARPEYAKVAQEIAYTEGFTHISFGAMDCNETMSNKYICNKLLGIVNYPRFIYFKNGTYDRMYTVKCPRLADFFYNWLLHKGNERYCSGSGSSWTAVTYDFVTSSSSFSLHQTTTMEWPFLFASSPPNSFLLISLTFILVPFYLMKGFMSFS